MSLSDLIQKGPQPLAPRVVIYGGDGIGKSTFASQFPSPLFLDIEGGLGSLDVASIDLVDAPFQKVLEAIALLIKEEHEFQTIVIDSLDWLEKRIFAAVCEEKKISSIEDVPYGKGYVFALNYWGRIVNGLDMLRKERGMASCLIAHAKVRQVADPTVSAFSRWDLQLHDKAANTLKQWADVVGFASYETIVVSKQGDFGRTQVRATSSGERWLWTNEEPAFDAKNRFGISDKLPLEYAALKNHL